MHQRAKGHTWGLGAILGNLGAILGARGPCFWDLGAIFGPKGHKKGHSLWPQPQDIVKEGPVTRQQDKVRPKLTKSEANELISNLIGTQVDLFAVGSSDPEAGASPSPSPALTPALALALSQVTLGVYTLSPLGV